MKTAKQVGIHSNTRIKTLLDVDSHAVVNELIKLNPNFSKLKNPILRKLFANRVTIAEACKIVNCKVEDFFKSMNRIGFLITTEKPILTSTAQHKGIDFSRITKTIELDARPFLKNNQDPLKEILLAVNKLQAGDRLKITNTFEPVPLINLLKDKGFSYDVEYPEVDVVVTWFEKPYSEEGRNEFTQVSLPVDDPELFDLVFKRFKPDEIRYIDVRELQMPQPMLLILENIETLPADHLLFIFHKKVPAFLLPELHKKGMTYLINHKSVAQVDMLIYKS